jgi:hypothetical protein
MEDKMEAEGGAEAEGPFIGPEQTQIDHWQR